MAAPDLGRLLRVPGRLVADPTTLAGSFPYGGTALGTVREVAVRASVARLDVTAEEFGVEVVDQLYAGATWVVAAILRGLDDDAVQKVFPATAAGASSARRVVQHPGTTRAGTLRSGSSLALLFAPDDADRHPAVLFHRALPLPEEAAELALSLDRDLEVPVVFAAIRNASGNAVSVGLMEDLAL